MQLKSVLAGQHKNNSRILFSEYIASTVPMANELVNLDLNSEDCLRVNYGVVLQKLRQLEAMFLTHSL